MQAKLGRTVQELVDSKLDPWHILVRYIINVHLSPQAVPAPANTGLRGQKQQE